MDKFDRYPGETDAEFRVRIIDIPVIKGARNAFWRVQGMKNQDDDTGWIVFDGQRIAISNIKISHISTYEPINVLGRFDPVDLYDKVIKDE